MNKISNCVKTLLFCLIVTQAAQAQPGVKYNLIPYPQSLTALPGYFTVNSATALVIEPGASRFENEKNFLQQMLRSYFGTSAFSESKTASKNIILLRYDSGNPNPEGYSLSVGADRIVLAARDGAGMFYAIETLRQLLPAAVEKSNGNTLTVPAVKISDDPAFSWRGMHLDVSRHFFSVEYLQKYVDMMALYKFNKLHLHLTDDQGWRIEIKKYPKLTEEGAWRSFNNQDSICMNLAVETGNPDFKIDPRHIIQRDGKTLYGGFYTQQQMKDFIAYAGLRHVEVIPEIDMPGHMMAAVKIYPWLTCDSTVGDGRGFSNPICPCNEDVLKFAKDIFSEIADLFPSQYIHIGGDEVEKSNWEKSPVCRAFMQQKGYTNLSQLQSYFNDYMQAFFKTRGKILLGWDEIVEGGIDPSALVMFWRPWATNMVSKAAANGNKVVMTPDGPLYFDATPDAKTISDVYHYNPFDTVYHLTPALQKNIIGVQANLWSEWIPTEQRADYMIMPRMTALAELGWTHRPLYDSYLTRVAGQYDRWDAMKINYRMPDMPLAAGEQVFVDPVHFFQQSPSSHFILRYTIDGTLPREASPVFSKPLNIDQETVVKYALFGKDGRRGDIYTVHFKKTAYHKAVSVIHTKAGLLCEFYKAGFNSTAAIKGVPDSVYVVTGVKVPPTAKAPLFGIKFKGYVQVPETGTYDFSVDSDDGSVLKIGDVVVVDNDGLHGPREKGGQAALAKGWHTFEVDFIQGGGDYKLDVKYKKASEKIFRPVAGPVLRHD